ncbi:hypothetical protein RhiirA5_406975 [Rhizophagus irregularis]|uniref:Cadherin domain-containing protein n=1 Tax=Rhizophagus irregularis TaxID=588596 RepID=A0A2N0QBP0_9GLOM|nr:hypothetical protein RhiirA5_406975 [Rhizophagus irregularis]
MNIEGRDIGLPCSANLSSSSVYANLKPFPPVSNQSVDYTVEGVMLDYEITPYKTEIAIAYADQNVLDDLYIKVLDFHYAKAAPFSIDVPDVPTPLLTSKYAITVIIADNPNKPKTHACSYAIFG